VNIMKGALKEVQRAFWSQVSWEQESRNASFLSSRQADQPGSTVLLARTALQGMLKQGLPARKRSDPRASTHNLDWLTTEWRNDTSQRVQGACGQRVSL